MTNETIADIIAEMRALSNPISDGIIAINGRIIADRLDAARKREIEATAAKCCQLGRLAGYGASEIKHLQEPVGDAAKLREVVSDLLYMAERYVKKTPATESVIFDAKTKKEIRTVNYYDVIAKAQAALAAPPRNCDVYNNESCRMAYHLHGDGLMTMQAFADWLFAPATEKEGGAK